MNCFIKRVLISVYTFICAGCTSGYAPVEEAWSIDSAPQGGYVVQKGDTLYAIAWRYDKDYRTLAEANHLAPPYALHTGQFISLTPPPPPPKKSVESKSPFTPIAGKSVQKIQWHWPAKGHKLIKSPSLANKKGINIAGKEGEPIYAAASGKIAYCGNGLLGYGNLIIIKHNDEFLSAYAHNQKLLVKEGQTVKGGQIIATMGHTESSVVMLHFEIRKAGKPVAPLFYSIYLPAF